MTLTKASFSGESTEQAEEDRQAAGDAMPEQMNGQWFMRQNVGSSGMGDKRVGGGGCAGMQGVPGMSMPARAGRGG